MLYGRIVRPSALEAKLVTSDTKAAEAMPGVVVVRDGDFIGVVAPDLQTAIRAEKAIAVHWQAPGQPGNDELFEYLKKRNGWAGWRWASGWFDRGWHGSR